MSSDQSAFFSTMSVYFRPKTDWRSCSGKGVTAAIIDSGVDDSHPDLRGRVIEAVDARVEKNNVVFDPSMI
jgi:subtilisin family serine protease